MTRLALDWPPGYKTMLKSVIQGQFDVSSNSEVTLTTVLGSCVSVCLYDPVVKIGGMNHYLLAHQTGDGEKSLKYGAHSMELLINALLKAGAARTTLEAKVFGGAEMSGRFDHIGPANAKFAMDYLRTEGFRVLAQDTGGKDARRINFHPMTGKVRVIHTSDKVAAQPVAHATAAVQKPRPSASILF